LSKFDALIIGGGPAGATASLLLAKAGWSVVLVEKSSFPRRKVCGEYLSPTNFGLLDRLGVLGSVLEHAGPEIRTIELLWKSTSIVADMPCPSERTARWGKAVRREILDTLMVNQAKEIGVTVLQPFSVIETKRFGDLFVSKALSKNTGEVLEIESPVVIAAHGSWGIGELPTQSRRQPARGSDLLAFKIYLENGSLPLDVMNMLVIPGGYAGMVNCDSGLLSFSCCIRRDHLDTLRQRSPNQKAGAVVYEHVIESCPGLKFAVNNSRQNGDWIAAGPMRPGIRRPYKEGLFSVGNAAGEAHPTIADGISMAMQSSWLLSNALIKRNPSALAETDRDEIGHEFSRDWLRAFRLRIRAAELFARLCLRKETHRLLLPLIRTFPQILTLGARLGGITDEVVK
jgi:flavin-dependent dehydrogenase